MNTTKVEQPPARKMVYSSVLFVRDKLFPVLQRGAAGHAFEKLGEVGRLIKRKARSDRCNGHVGLFKQCDDVAGNPFFQHIAGGLAGFLFECVGEMAGMDKQLLRKIARVKTAFRFSCAQFRQVFFHQLYKCSGNFGTARNLFFWWHHCVILHKDSMNNVVRILPDSHFETTPIILIILFSFLAR